MWEEGRRWGVVCCVGCGGGRDEEDEERGKGGGTGEGEVEAAVGKNGEGVGEREKEERRRGSVFSVHGKTERTGCHVSSFFFSSDLGPCGCSL